MTDQPSWHVDYNHAQDSLHDLMKYFAGLQPSNPHMNEARAVWATLAQLFDASAEWEKLNPGVDKESQQEIAQRQFWIKQAEKGIFSEQAFYEFFGQDLAAEDQQQQERKKRLEDLLDEENQQ